MRGLEIYVLLVSSLVFSEALVPYDPPSLEERKIVYKVYAALVGKSLSELGIDENDYEFVNQIARERMVKRVFQYLIQLTSAKADVEKSALNEYQKQKDVDFIENLEEAVDYIAFFTDFSGPQGNGTHTLASGRNHGKSKS